MGNKILSKIEITISKSEGGFLERTVTINGDVVYKDSCNSDFIHAKNDFIFNFISRLTGNQFEDACDGSCKLRELFSLLRKRRV